MKFIEIDFDEIITKRDLNDGNLILLTSRPAVGKTQTCVNLIKKYKDQGYLYFDLDSAGSDYWLQNNKDLQVCKEFMSSLEIIKTIEQKIKSEKIKFVFIDYWQLVTDREDWFVKKLLSLSWSYKVVFVITSQLSRKVDGRRSHLPNLKDINNIKILGRLARKVIVISRPAMYYGSKEVEDKLHYLVCRDWENSYVNQDKKQ